MKKESRSRHQMWGGGRRKGAALKWLFVFLVAGAASVIGATSKSAPSFDFEQGVIVDPAHGSIYLMNPEGRIDAVRLSSGEVFATSTWGAKPLLVFDIDLLAQEEAVDQSDKLKLGSLSTTDLKLKFEVGVPLPAGVYASIGESLGRSFYVSARTEKDEVVVQWRSVQRRVSGVPTNEPAQVAAGLARIDPRTGRLLASGGDASGPESGKAKWPIVVQKLVDSGALLSQLCWVDDLLVAIEYGQDDGREHVMLRRWNKDTGQNLPSVELFGSELTFRYFSVDCRHLLASRAKDGWLWSIFETMTGNKIAGVHSTWPGSQFFICKGSVIYQTSAEASVMGGHMKLVQPLRLLAIDFNTGREL